MLTLYQGREKIVIPVSKEDFEKSEESKIAYIKKYLDKTLKINETNKNNIEELYKYYRGEQSIQFKTRLDENTQNNNKVVLNHIYRQVEFKKGFMVGQPIEYSIATTVENDDLTYLNKYMRDSCKASKDVYKYEQLYVCGLANQFIIPKKTEFEIGKESPFELCNLEPGAGYVVYSNDTNDTPLFNVTIGEKVKISENGVIKKYKVYDVYYLKNEDNNRCYSFTVKKENGKFVYPEFESKQPYHFLPIVEYTLNHDRMGIVELVASIQDALNLIHSNQIDDVIDFVNAYLVFENQTIDKEFRTMINEFKQKRVLAIKTTNPQTPAKVSLLKQSLDHQDVNSLYDLLENEMYDIVACPRCSGNVTSGGDTGSARLLGNGWETAQTQAQVDTTYIQQYEYELLKKIILICKKYKQSGVETISASDIEIKYSINMSNNLLIKAQALRYLHDIKMPKQEALAMTGITGDTHGVGMKWENYENDKLLKEQQAENEKQVENEN